jgi:hypothetical protein
MDQFEKLFKELSQALAAVYGDPKDEDETLHAGWVVLTRANGSWMARSPRSHTSAVGTGNTPTDALVSLAVRFGWLWDCLTLRRAA